MSQRGPGVGIFLRYHLLFVWLLMREMPVRWRSLSMEGRGNTIDCSTGVASVLLGTLVHEPDARGSQGGRGGGGRF